MGCGMARPRNFNDILDRLPGAKQSGDSWTAPCPLPGHKTPAGHVTAKDGGDKALIYDQGGKHAYQDYCQAWGFDSLAYSDSDIGPEPRQKTLVATFNYEYEKGKEAYQIRRFDLGNGRKTFEVWHKKDGKYVPRLPKGQKPILYRLPELQEAVRNGRTILLPEGEEKVNRLRELGFEATTNPFGAGKWNDSYTKEFPGADVVILPDYDKPGLAFVEQKAKALHDTAKRVCILQITDIELLKKSTGKDGVDIIDWLDNGGTVDELMRLVDACPNYEPSDGGVKLRCMADIQAESVSWLWKPYIPKGKVTLLEGDPGIGKSWVSLAIATAVSLGKGLPGTEAIESASVVLASAEDGLGDTIRPRLDTMGADVSRILAIDGLLTLDKSGFALLEAYLEGVHPTLLIIDPLFAYLGAGVDIHRANETRAVMARLARLAEKFGTAILAARHLTKGGMSKAIYRGLGSIDITAACRSVLLAGCDTENPQNWGLVHTKSNLAPKGTTIGYELREDGFHWTGESTLTAAQILATDSGDSTSVMDEAIAFLRDELASGPISASQVFSDGKGAGLSEITIKRAKAKLGIVTRRQGETGKRGGGRFTWELPVSHLEGQDDLEYQEAHIRENDTLNNSSLKSDPLPKTDDTLNTPEAILGMPVEKALELWRSEGAPIIHLGTGENCLDLAKLLSNPDTNERHLEAVKTWLEKRNQQPEGNDDDE